MMALARLPLPYRVTVLVLGLLAVGEQALEYYLYMRRPQVAPVFRLEEAMGFVLLLIYLLIYLGLLKQEAVQGLVGLRPAVLVDDAEYDAHARRILRANPWIELGLAALAGAAVWALFGESLGKVSQAARGAWTAPLVVSFVAAIYALFGWLLLTLVYTGIRCARALGHLAQRPLAVNVFDPLALQHFGRLSLLPSISFATVSLIPLILYGPPRLGGYVIIPLALISLLALLAPIWGVHRQMVRAKEAAQDAIHAQLARAQEIALRVPEVDPQELKAAADRTALLLNLRRAIREGPNWPFQTEAAVARAITAAVSPLIYFILNELLSAYVVPLFR
jgi:hypothetical protein